VPVYDACVVEHPDGMRVVGVDMQQVAEDTLAQAAEKARQDIAKSDLFAEVMSAVHDRIAGKRVFAHSRPSVEDLKEIVASHTERLVLANQLPAEHRLYFRRLVAEQCEARSTQFSQRRRSSNIKAAMSGFLSLPAFAAASVTGVRAFAPGRIADAAAAAPAVAPSNGNRRLLDYNADVGSGNIGASGALAPPPSPAVAAQAEPTIAFAVATVIGPALVSLSAAHAVLAAMNGRRALLYRDLAASLRIGTGEAV
jgi:hypothetical protein